MKDGSPSRHLRDGVNVLGVILTPTSLTAARDQILAWVTENRREYVCVCTVHTVMECQRADETRLAVNAAGMRTTDGMPLVWLSRLANHKGIERVYGPDLMLATMKSGVERGIRHYLFGGQPGVPERLTESLKERFPGIAICGAYAPPMASAEALSNEQIAAAIDKAKPDIVWVGISTPKQDLWMKRIRPNIQASVLVGVGAAFNIHAGLVKQAPRLLQRTGLEWLFRLSQEPGRLWRRYLIYNSWFLYEVARQKLGLKKYDAVVLSDDPSINAR